jgi:tetratricopeptide (TPR) repeat protein
MRSAQPHGILRQFSNHWPRMPQSTSSQTQESIVAQAVEAAVALHRGGWLDKAEHLYREILKVAPHNFDALHLLGLIRQQRGESQDALLLIDSALAILPDSAPALSNRGAVLQSVGRYNDALASFDKSIALVPDNIDAHSNRGNVLYSLGRYEESLAALDLARTLAPNHPETLSRRGLALLALDRAAEALRDFDAALVLAPHYADAHNNRGNVLRKLRRYDEAYMAYDRALTHNPDLAVARVNRGAALIELQRPVEALADLDRCLAREPDRADLLCLRGDALAQLERLEEALASYMRALEIEPGNIMALNNAGVTLCDLRRPEEALRLLEEARHGAPDFALVQFNEAVARILLGEYLQGWREYEARWGKPDMARDRRDFTVPLWLGEGDLTGKTVLLHAEQGFGDTLQFVRYAPLVAQRGVNVVLEVPPVLKRLMQGMDGVTQVVARGEALPAVDLHCPLLSLPHAFRTELASIPKAVPYLRVPESLVAQWESRIPQTRKLKVGLAWAGKAGQKHDHSRSLGLAQMSSLLAVEGVQFVSLQRELRDGDDEILRQHPDVPRLGETFSDFADTAAVMAQLDVVISVDTSVAHLAGALGKPLWLLLAYGGDWHWIVHGRDDSPWYPTAKLFRQHAPGDWTQALASVVVELSRSAASKAN